ncbi:MAG: hypothetical protein K1X67_21815 [Fimbriimonadaceae bacterium]|nr:hypothetical protein [Fimbriimonadaceae bacterium]
MKPYLTIGCSLAAIAALTAAISAPKNPTHSLDDKGKPGFKRQDLSPLDDLLQKRLHVIDGKNFGVRRIGSANPHDLLVFRPEVPEEMNLVEKYRSQGFEIVIFTAGYEDAYRWLHRTIKDQSGKEVSAPMTKPPVRLGGPVFLDPERANGFDAHEALRAAAEKLLTSKSLTEAGQKFNEYTLYASPVMGDARCVNCHIDSAGNQVKDGARIGFLIYLVRKIA